MSKHAERMPLPWRDWIAAAERELRDTADAAREAGDPIAAIDSLLDDLDNLRAGRSTWRRVLADQAGDDDALRCL
jgi:hypothetical protein